MSDPEAPPRDDLPAPRPLPDVPASAGAGLTATLAALPPETARAVVAHSAEVARELRAVIDNVRGPDGKPTLVARFESRDKRTGQVSVHEHVTAEGWAMLGAMVGVGCRIAAQRPVDYSHPVHKPRAFGWEAVAVAFDRASGEELAAEHGMCLRDERRWADAPDYAVRSMAATRARGRAYKAVLGYVMRLAGYDPSPAEEVIDAVEVERQAPPAGSGDLADARATKAQRDAIERRLERLNSERPGDVPEPPVGREVTDEEPWAWDEYLERLLDENLGVGIEGLTRRQASQVTERLDGWLKGNTPPALRSAAAGMPAATPAEAAADAPAGPDPASRDTSEAPAAATEAAGEAVNPPAAATSGPPGGSDVASPAPVGDVPEGSPAGAPDPWADKPVGAAGGLEGKMREAQVRSMAERAGLPEADLVRVLEAAGVRAESIAHDLAADHDRYRAAVAAVQLAVDAFGNDSAPPISGAESASGSGADADDEPASAGEGAAGAAPAAVSDPPPASPGPDAGEEPHLPAGAAAVEECTACGGPAPGGGVCADCRAYGLA
jgi:hypothetical protein